MESFLRPNQELIAVKYFSARPTDVGKRKRQDAFFQANKENPKFKLILGKYLKKEIECFKCHNIIHTYEEKESDVRIATQIVADAFQHRVCHNCFARFPFRVKNSFSQKRINPLNFIYGTK